MAKVGFWLRGAKGKLAGASLSKGPYGTVAREIVTPKNPNTEAQVIQRILMGTVGKAYSRMKTICDHSFEGVAVGAKSMAFFMQQNLNALRTALAQAYANEIDLSTLYAFTPLGSSAMMANPYIIAQGSLPSVPVVENAADHVPYILVGDNTYQGVCDQYGLKRGDQLTFCVVTHRANSQSHDFAFIRVILDPRNADGSAADMSSAFISNGTVNLPSHLNEGNFAVATIEGDKLFFNVDGGNQCACGVIVSRDVNGQWLRSNTTMTMLKTADGISFQTALDRSKQRLAIQTESDYYLNNAGVSNATGNTIESALTYNVTGTGQVVMSVDEEVLENGALVNAGKSVVVEFTPSGDEIVSQVTLNGQSLTVTNNSVTFVMPAQAASLRVVFSVPTYRVTVNSTGQGSVTFSANGNTFTSGATLAAGTEVTVTATPSQGQTLKSLNWNGTAIASGNSFTMPRGTVTINAVFSGGSASDDDQ